MIGRVKIVRTGGYDPENPEASRSHVINCTRGTEHEPGECLDSPRVRPPRAPKPRKSYLYFEGPHASATGKTSIWIVHANESGARLGEVRWFGRWRCYAFFPFADTAFERHCLRDIAEFCEKETRARR